MKTQQLYQLILILELRSFCVFILWEHFIWAIYSHQLLLFKSLLDLTAQEWSNVWVQNKKSKKMRMILTHFWEEMHSKSTESTVHMDVSTEQMCCLSSFVSAAPTILEFQGHQEKWCATWQWTTRQASRAQGSVSSEVTVCCLCYPFNQCTVAVVTNEHNTWLQACGMGGCLVLF